MAGNRKTAQLQIRIAPDAKRRLVRAARRAGKDVSTYVLDMVLPPRREQLERTLADLDRTTDPAFVFAALNDLLGQLGRGEFARVVGPEPSIPRDPLAANLFAAMVEHRAGTLGVPVPRWTADVESLAQPYFASDLQNLRAHLLVASPPAYRRRNLFVDAVVGDRV